MIVIPILIICFMFIWNCFHLPKLDDLDAEGKPKFREYLVLDIRGANQYCLGYIALFGVMTVILSNHSDIKSVIGSDIYVFAAAFIAACISILFVPSGYGQRNFPTLRVVWFKTIFCEQIVVILGSYGMINLFLKFIIDNPAFQAHLPKLI